MSGLKPRPPRRHADSCGALGRHDGRRVDERGGSSGAAAVGLAIGWEGVAGAGGVGVGGYRDAQFLVFVLELVEAVVDAALG